MQSENRILSDIARLASGAAGVAAGMREEVETQIRQKLQTLLADMDLVSREEFDAVKAVAAKAREEQEVLAQRVAKLEAGLAAEFEAESEG
jgi:BMFP domain-containing protein YqiC